MSKLLSQHHTFDIGLATEYGMGEAVLIHHFQHWIRVNRLRGKNIHEGRCWTYQTKKEIQAHFVYMTYEEVKYLCEKLIERGVLITRNFNKSSLDRTLWYAFADEARFGVDEESLDGLNNFKTKKESELKEVPKIQKMFPKRENSLMDGENSLMDGENSLLIPDTKTTDSIKKKGINTAVSPAAHCKKQPPITFDFSTREFQNISPEDLKEWQAIYSDVDVSKALMKTKQWILSRPSRIERRKSLRSLIITWLENTQDKTMNRLASQAARKEDVLSRHIGLQQDKTPIPSSRIKDYSQCV